MCVFAYTRKYAYIIFICMARRARVYCPCMRIICVCVRVRLHVYLCLGLCDTTDSKYATQNTHMLVLVHARHKQPAHRQSRICNHIFGCRLHCFNIVCKRVWLYAALISIAVVYPFGNVGPCAPIVHHTLPCVSFVVREMGKCSYYFSPSRLFACTHAAASAARQPRHHHFCTIAETNLCSSCRSQFLVLFIVRLRWVIVIVVGCCSCCCCYCSSLVCCASACYGNDGGTARTLREKMFVVHEFLGHFNYSNSEQSDCSTTNKIDENNSDHDLTRSWERTHCQCHQFWGWTKKLVRT